MLDHRLQMVRRARVGRAARPTPVSTTVLVARATQAFREGRAAAWSMPALDAVQTQIERQVLARLTPADQIALAKLTAPRERALALARSGQHDAAAASMKVAGLLLTFARFSREGRAYAQTLHHAADSYLLFRTGHHAEARARMLAAIDATAQLGTWWGDSEFIACRRVHLAHNVMRVDVASGATGDATRLGAELLSVLGSTGVTGSTSDPRARLTAPTDARVAELFYNFVMETIAELLAALPASEAGAVVRSLSLTPPSADRRAWRGWTWLAIKAAALSDDPSHFLTAAEPFLRAGRQTTPSLWYAVALDLARVSAALNIGALSEITTELTDGTLEFPRRFAAHAAQRSAATVGWHLAPRSQRRPILPFRAVPSTNDFCPSARR